MMRMTVTASRRIAAVGVLLVLLALCSVRPAVWADPTVPGANERHITKAVVYLLSQQHLLGRDVDDQASQRCLTSFLKALDPWKLYFYQSDVDDFMKSQNDLDDLAKKGDVTFAHKVFQVYLQRIDERVAVIDELLAMKHDFTVDEEMPTDRDMTSYPRTAAEARDRWRKRIKYSLLDLKVDGTEGQAATDKLSRRYHSLTKRMHQTDSDELLEMYLTSLSSSFDPHTSYMSPSTLENFEIIMRLELEGIGASLQSEEGYTVIKKIIPGGAADRDGRLKIEDKIVGVRKDPQGEMVDTIDMKLSDVVDMIRGPKGTVVELEVDPGDGTDRKVIDITRAQIELKDSEAQAMVFENGRKADGKPYRIGVIDLPSFYMDMEGARRGDPNYRSTTRDVRVILDDFTRQGVDAVVLDLRRNGGGSLTEAISLTGLFINEGPVVQVKDGKSRVHAYTDLEPGTSWSGPLVVLISKFSASASEILAGAIQDYGRGLIVGDHATHGKGTVQSLTDLGQELLRGIQNAPKLGALKITMQQFYRPNGDSTQNRGVLSDVELPSLTSYLDVGETDLDYPLAFDHVPSQDFQRLPLVDQATCQRLKDLSQQRCSQSSDFQKTLRNITRYQEQKTKKYVTLNEEKFLKERAELNADKEEEKTIEKLNDPDKPTIERDYYMNEALNIAVDYMNLKQVVSVR